MVSDNDTGKEVLRDGWVSARDKDHVQDLYLFVYGNDYKSALRSLRVVSGPAPMPRKYVHGSWYCRWWNYTDDDYRQLVREYKEHDFPLDIMVLIWDGILRMLPLVRAMQEPEGGQVIVGTGN